MPSAIAERVPIPLLFHVTLAALLLAVLWRPIHDSDLFWQLRLGELTLERGWPPDREPFLADKTDEPLVPVAWFGQAVYAEIRWLGGYPVLHLVDGLLWIGSLFAVGWSARRSGGGPWATALAVVFANFVAYSSVSTRPQTFSLVGFGLLIALVRSDATARVKILAGFLLLVLWQNFHPSVAMGGAWLAGVATVRWVQSLRTSAPMPWAETILTVLTPIAMAATPAGTELFRVSAYNAEVSRWLGISEWLPLWELEALDRLEVWIGLAASGVLLLVRGRRIRAEDLVPALGFAVMAFASYRFVLFWAAAMIPVWVAGISSIDSRRLTASPLGRRGRLLAVFAWGTAVAVPTVKHPTHLADYFPVAAIERLHGLELRGTVYCNTVWAGLIVDTGMPNWRVSHDGRYYLRSIPEWEAYRAASRGEVPVVELVHRHEPVAFVLRTGFDDGLITLLRRENGWRELPLEKECVVFVRANPVPKVDTGPRSR